MKQRVSFAATLTLLAATLAGCQRGCLATWWGSHTSGAGAQQNPTIPPEEKPGCVGGFVRCSGGALQASRAVPNTHCTPEGCVCPWDDVGKCDRGCVLQGVPFEMTVDAGTSQLCLPDDQSAVLGPEQSAQTWDAGEEFACEMEGYFCRNGRVSSCGNKIAIPCVRGCADLGDMQLDEEDDDLHTAALVLCARH